MAGCIMCFLGMCTSSGGLRSAVCRLAVEGPQSFLPLTCLGMEHPGTGAEGHIYELVLRSGGTSGTFSDHLLDL